MRLLDVLYRKLEWDSSISTETETMKKTANRITVKIGDLYKITIDYLKFLSRMDRKLLIAFLTIFNTNDKSINTKMIKFIDKNYYEFKSYHTLLALAYVLSNENKDTTVKEIKKELDSKNIFCNKESLEGSLRFLSEDSQFVYVEIKQGLDNVFIKEINTKKKKKTKKKTKKNAKIKL